MIQRINKGHERKNSVTNVGRLYEIFTLEVANSKGMLHQKVFQRNSERTIYMRYMVYQKLL